VQGAGVDLLRLSYLLSTNPAKLANFEHKGFIAPKMDADLVVSFPKSRPLLFGVASLRCCWRCGC
jgi:dihydroorotase-like cyclic amidohydrolase